MIYANATAAPRDELTDVIMEGLTDDSQFIGLKLLPEAPSSQLLLHVPKITIADGNLMRATNKKRTPGAKFDRWQAAIDDYSATLVQEGEEIQIPDETSLTYEDYFDLEGVYSTEVSNRLLRGTEIESAAAIDSTGNFDQVNSTVAYTTANKATISVVDDIIAAIRRVKGRGEKPNTISMSGQVYDRIRTSTLLQAFIAGSINPGAVVTPDTITAAFKSMGINQTLVGEGYVNQSQETTNNSINAIWANDNIFVGNVASGALRSGGVGRTFYWEKDGPLFHISSYRDEPVKSNVIRAQKTTLSAITNARAGTLIGTQYS